LVYLKLLLVEHPFFGGLNDNLLSNKKRLVLNEILTKLAGIKFFISCVTGTTSHSFQSDTKFTAGVSYFICYRPSKEVNERVIHDRFHDGQVEFTLKSLKSKSKKEDDVMAVLKQTVKVLFIK